MVDLRVMILACLMVGLLSMFSPLEKTSMDQLFSTSCALQLKSMSEKDVLTLESIAPPPSFMDQVSLHMKNQPHPTILLLEVDLASRDLALNNIENLRLSNSSVVPIVVAYEKGVCEQLKRYAIDGCYFDAKWTKTLASFYTALPKSHPKFINGERAMLGRMMTTIFTLCAGYNVFVSDSDIVYYRDPMNYVFLDADVMITSTFIDPRNRNDWGGYYFVDRPREFSTMNNGVVLFKSTEVVRSLHMTMAVEGIRNLLVEGDKLHAFLQVVFNKQLVKHNFMVHPCSAVSDPTTKKFDILHPTFGGNRAGECYDCYYGTLNWTSNVVHTQKNGASPLPLRMGVFPMERFLSHCSYQHVQKLRNLTAAAAAALWAGDATGWGWGEDVHAAGSTGPDHTSYSSQNAQLSHHRRRLKSFWDSNTRPLSVHANCISGGSYKNATFSNKEKVLRAISAWYVQL